MHPVGIYDRVRLMAVSVVRVTDPDTIPGKVQVSVDPRRWCADPDAATMGALMQYDPRPRLRSHARGGLTVAFTRFIVDAGIDVNDLLDDAFTDARRRPGWTELSAVRGPITDRTAGSTRQIGTYLDSSGDRYFSATRHVLYQRANVVSLLDCSGWTASEDDRERSALTEMVESAWFED